MDHLACFAGGMFGLAAEEEEDKNSERWLKLAGDITNTCHESYDRSDTKLGPEAMRFSDSIEARALKQNERYYILRPETVESYFLMWRLTKDPKYRDWGWEMVQALDRHCKAEGGYSGIRNVYQVKYYMLIMSLLSLVLVSFKCLKYPRIYPLIQSNLLLRVAWVGSAPMRR